MIFSIAMGAEYSFYVKYIATFAPTFYGYIISLLASVLSIAIPKATLELIFCLFITVRYHYGQNFRILIKNYEAILISLIQIP